MMVKYLRKIGKFAAFILVLYSCTEKKVNVVDRAYCLEFTGVSNQVYLCSSNDYLMEVENTVKTQLTDVGMDDAIVGIGLRYLLISDSMYVSKIVLSTNDSMLENRLIEEVSKDLENTSFRFIDIQNRSEVLLSLRYEYIDGDLVEGPKYIELGDDISLNQ